MTPGSTAPARWRFSLAAQGDWYENAVFLGATSADPAWSTEGRASLSHNAQFRTGTFSISASGGGIYYPELEAFSQPTYGGSLNLTLTPNRRQTTIRLAQRYEHSNTRYLTPVDAEGLPLPTSESDYATTSLGLEHRLARGWQVALDASYQYRAYQGTALQDGEQLDGSARLGYQVGRRSLLYLGYRYESAWSEEKQRAHEVLVGGLRSVNRGVGFELAAGFGYVETSREFFPSARAGLTAAGRRAGMSVLYYRDFGQAYGYGQQMVGDLVAGVLSWSPVDRLSLSAQYDFGYRRDPDDEDNTIRSHIVGGGFGLRVGGGVAFRMSYRWERNESSGRPVLEGSRATASLSYGVDWR